MVAPLLVYYETFQTARIFAEGFSFGPRDFLANLARVAGHLLRYEFLLPALLFRVGVVWLGAGDAAGPRAASRLLAFAAGYVAVVCLNPLPLERYFVVLSPLLAGVLLLDAFALTVAMAERAAPSLRQRAGKRAALVLALVVLVCRVPSLEELGGRLEELRTPHRGPLDYVVSLIQERYADPRALVIATNYEEYPLMYYLESHVIIGLTLNNLARDQRLQPDVVIPRRRWPRSLEALRPLLARGSWEEQRVPVRDTHHNSFPALSRTPFTPDPHRYATPSTDDPAAQLVLYLRRPPGVHR